MGLEAKEHEELLMNWAVAFFTYLSYTVLIVVRDQRVMFHSFVFI